MGFTSDYAGTCDECSEPFDTRSPEPSVSEVGEFYDRTNPVADSKICHAQCGLDAGLTLA